MSFILDALKKAERQRPPGPVPDLFAVHGPQVPPARRPGRAIIAGALLLAAAALFVWAWPAADRRDGDAGRLPVDGAPPSGAAAPAESVPATRVAVLPAPAPASRGAAVARRPADRRSRADARPSEATQAATEQPTPPVAVPDLPPAPVIPSTAELPAPPSPAEAPAVTPAGQAHTGETPPAAAPADGTPAGAPEVAAPIPSSGPEAAPPADGRVLDLAELPAPIRAGLPKLLVSGHVWSEEPALRLLSVDDRLLHEGGEAAPGVRLQAITPAGAVFVYQGWRFRVAGGRP